MEEVIAISKNIKISPRKVRLVADAVKKEKLPVALAKLYALNKRASGPIKKALESAIANAVHNHQVNKDDLTIKDIIVGEGITYKRYHYASRGRVHPYKRRTSHIRVVLSAKTAQAPAPVQQEVKEAEKKVEVKKEEAAKEVKPTKKVTKAKKEEASK